MCGALVMRERIACSAVGVATPSTRRASTLCHVPRVTEVTCAEAGVPAGTHSVVTPHQPHTGVCAAMSATCTACDTSAHLERRKVGDDGPLARPSSDPSDGGDG